MSTVLVAPCPRCHVHVLAERLDHHVARRCLGLPWAPCPHCATPMSAPALDDHLPVCPLAGELDECRFCGQLVPEEQIGWHEARHQGRARERGRSAA